jgi:hypothetical protein
LGPYDDLEYHVDDGKVVSLAFEQRPEFVYGLSFESALTTTVTTVTTVTTSVGW